MFENDTALARTLGSEGGSDSDRRPTPKVVQGASAAPSKPTVLPVMYRPTSEAQTIEARYQCRLTSDDRADRYLTAIDGAMKTRADEKEGQTVPAKRAHFAVLLATTSAVPAQAQAWLPRKARHGVDPVRTCWSRTIISGGAVRRGRIRSESVLIDAIRRDRRIAINGRSACERAPSLILRSQRRTLSRLSRREPSR